MNNENLFQLLLKNLPSLLHCSNNKSGAYSKAPVPSHFALKRFDFIEFNSKERVTIVVFDKDMHLDKTAKKYFSDIPNFLDWLNMHMSIVPNYICETTKGFQFAFIINGFMTVQSGYNPKNSPEQYLHDIKQKYIKTLQLDEIASSRTNAIFRNPYKHRYIAFTNVKYSLTDLNNGIYELEEGSGIKSYQKAKYLKVHKNKRILANRNCSIFKLCCNEFAYSKPTKKQVFSFIKKCNENCIDPLPIQELKSITNSIYKRTQENSLKSGSKKAALNKAKLVKDRKKYIIKFILNSKKNKTKINKTKLAKELGISVVALNKTYGNFIDIRIKNI